MPSTIVDAMPQWIDDSHLDPTWFTAQTQIPCTKITAQDISTNQGRVGSVPRDGGTLLLTCETDGGVQQSLVLKQCSALQLSRQLGLAREALFYRDRRSTEFALPKIYYAYGDMETGEKCVIMESLSDDAWIEAGYFFGPTSTFPSNPHNWSRPIANRLSEAFGNQTVPTAVDVARACFVAVAKIHATFWCHPSLLDYPWLRGHAWHQGQGQDSWEASQSLIQNIWQKAQSQTTIQWDDRVREAVAHCIKGISWDRRPQHKYWTLVHGDFWPGNILWNTTKNRTVDQLKLIDWEMVGLSSGPQDLGQYVISNMDPVDRRACEKELVRAYYDELLRNGVKDDENDLWDFCWNEYQIGGVERWLWFLVWFLGQENLQFSQFFHDQIAAFMHDHDLTAENLTQPRP